MNITHVRITGIKNNRPITQALLQFGLDHGFLLWGNNFLYFGNDWNIVFKSWYLNNRSMYFDLEKKQIYSGCSYLPKNILEMDVTNLDFIKLSELLSKTSNKPLFIDRYEVKFDYNNKRIGVGCVTITQKQIEEILEKFKKQP